MWKTIKFRLFFLQKLSWGLLKRLNMLQQSPLRFSSIGKPILITFLFRYSWGTTPSPRLSFHFLGTHPLSSCLTHLGDFLEFSTQTHIFDGQHEGGIDWRREAYTVRHENENNKIAEFLLPMHYPTNLPAQVLLSFKFLSHHFYPLVRCSRTFTLIRIPAHSSCPDPCHMGSLMPPRIPTTILIYNTVFCYPNLWYSSNLKPSTLATRRDHKKSAARGQKSMRIVLSWCRLEQNR